MSLGLSQWYTGRLCGSLVWGPQRLSATAKPLCLGHATITAREDKVTAFKGVQPNISLVRIATPMLC